MAQTPDSVLSPWSPEYKSPQRALGYSAGATLIPVAVAMAGNGRLGLAATGVLLGPSVGYFYGGCGKRGFTGILVRGGIVAASLPLARLAAELSNDTGEWAGLEEAFIVLGVATVFVCVHSAYDIFHVERAVTERNDRIAKSLGAAPLYSPARGAIGVRLCLGL